MTHYTHDTTADTVVQELYKQALQQRGAPLAILPLVDLELGQTIFTLWLREQEGSTGAEEAYGYLRGVGRWSYRFFPKDEGAGRIHIQALPSGLVEADYLAIMGFARHIARAERQTTLLEPYPVLRAAYEREMRERFLAAFEAYQHLMQAMIADSTPVPNPSFVHTTYLDLAQAVAGVTYRAICCFTQAGSAQEWLAWIERLRLRKIDSSFALLMCLLRCHYRAEKGMPGLDEYIALSEKLEIPYRYDPIARQWAYAEMAYSPIMESLASWRAHQCPHGGGERCRCEWGYLCQGCYNHRLVEGSALLRIEQRGGHCIRCWTAESTDGVAALLHQEL